MIKSSPSKTKKDTDKCESENDCQSMTVVGDDDEDNDAVQKHEQNVTFIYTFNH